MTDLHLYNSATRRKERFTPLDPSHVRMYVCGPTVYDLAHLGNARPVVVFDVLARLLRRLYPKVTYVRNITDVDDKIFGRARERGVPIGTITEATTADFHRDMAALNCLPPDLEPRATGHIAEMIALIKRLIENGHAYAADGHVLFSVPSFPDYGKLSNRDTEEMLAGARVDVAPYKRSEFDFVLWKPSTGDMPGWESPWGFGRPGWHIECSAMAWRHLGEEFDIHGGGSDLIFPHHENELAQSVCAFPGTHFAKLWMHNGMLLVDGQKMSKSLGNFFTIDDVLAKGPWAGEAFRLLLLKTHYRAPIDFTWGALEEARRELNRLYRLKMALESVKADSDSDSLTAYDEMQGTFEQWLCDDLNTHEVLARLRNLLNMAVNQTSSGSDADAPIGSASSLKARAQKAAELLGILQANARGWLHAFEESLPAELEKAIAARLAARKARNFAEADRIRDELKAQGIVLEDSAGGTTWRRAW